MVGCNVLPEVQLKLGGVIGLKRRTWFLHLRLAVLVVSYCLIVCLHNTIVNRKSCVILTNKSQGPVTAALCSKCQIQILSLPIYRHKCAQFIKKAIDFLFIT